MSIWSSCGITVPYTKWTTRDRDWYKGVEADPQDPREQWGFDVATATPWHDLIRFSVENMDHSGQHIDAQLVMSTDEARKVIDLLNEAISTIEASRNADPV